VISRSGSLGTAGASKAAVVARAGGVRGIGETVPLPGRFSKNAGCVSSVGAGMTFGKGAKLSKTTALAFSFSRAS